LSLDNLKKRLKEKAVGPIAKELIEKIDELIKLQKETNKILHKIEEKISNE